MIGEGDPVLVDDRHKAERDFIADGAQPAEDERTVGDSSTLLYRPSSDTLDVDLVVLPEPGEHRPITRLVGPEIVRAVFHAVAVVFERLPEAIEHRHREVAGGALHSVLAREGGDVGRRNV